MIINIRDGFFLSSVNPANISRSVPPFPLTRVIKIMASIIHMLFFFCLFYFIFLKQGRPDRFLARENSQLATTAYRVHQVWYLMFISSCWIFRRQLENPKQRIVFSIYATTGRITYLVDQCVWKLIEQTYIKY